MKKNSKKTQINTDENHRLTQIKSICVHLHLHNLRSSALTAQVMFEYIILVVIIIAALVTMQLYIKRAISGKWREAADGIGFQYDPFNTTSSFTTNTTTSRTETQTVADNTTISPGDTVKVTVTDTSPFSTTITRTGSETVGALGNSIWE